MSRLIRVHEHEHQLFFWSYISTCLLVAGLETYRCVLAQACSFSNKYAKPGQAWS